jgi:DNA-directed RNA polymerase subunit E'/Rpb7
METPKKAPSLKVSSLKDFKEQRQKLVEGVLIKLPDSGLTVKLARPSLEDLILNDKVPKELISIAVKKSAGQLNENDLKRVIELRDFVVAKALIEPKVVLKDPKENEVSIECFTRTDKDFIFSYVEKGDTVLEFFRSK